MPQLRRPTALTLALLSPSLALAACAGPSTSAPTQPAATQPASAATASAPSAGATGTVATTPARTASTRTPITAHSPLRIAFAGDIHFEGEKLAKVADDPDGLDSLRPSLSDADLTVVNLETAITQRGTPIPEKPFTFRAPASALTTLKNAGVDIAGMANNHSADYGAQGLRDTLAAKKASPIKVIGVGNDVDEADAPAVTTIGGVSVAVLNVTPLDEQTTEMYGATASKPGVASFVQPYTSPAAQHFLASVKDAASRYDVVIVWLHWGAEGETCPTDKQFEVEKIFKDAGADVIAGGHSHRVQAGGWDGTTYVNYGLGSFTWWLVPTHPETGVLTLSISPDAVAAKRAAGGKAPRALVTDEAWQPMLIGESGLPYVPKKATVARLNDERDALRGCSHLSAAPTR